MRKVSENPITSLSQDWGYDPSNKYPYSGEAVQKFIKDQLNSKMGVFYYDPDSNRYLCFATEDAKNEYLLNPTKVELVLGTFNAPFNYEATITLTTPSYVSISKGQTGNYVEFTFKTTNKSGDVIAESVTCTYTFIKGSNKQEFRAKYQAGKIARLNIDKFLSDGTNNIIITIKGDTTLAASSSSITYQVVDLKLTDNYDISQVYTLSEKESTVQCEFPYTLSGYGTKVVEWYLDGELLPFSKIEDEVVDVEASRTKYIPISNLSQGTHHLQVRAYTMLNGDKFYSDTIYKDLIVYTGVSTNNIIAVGGRIPSGQEILGPEEHFKIFNMVQYMPYQIDIATYSPLNKKSIPVQITLNEEDKGTLDSSNYISNEFYIISSRTGIGNLKITSPDSEYIIETHVAKTKLDLGEITEELQLDFNAIGKNNSASNKNQWSNNGYNGTFTGFNWNKTSGWNKNRLLVSEGATFSIDYAPLNDKNTDTGKTIEVEFMSTNVRNDDAILCDLRGPNGAGILITATKVSMISTDGVITSTEYKSEENVRISFVINKAHGTTDKGLTFIYTNGISSRCSNIGTTDNYTSPQNLTFTGTAGAQILLKQVRIYNKALSSDQILNNYTLYQDNVDKMLEIYERNDIYETGTTKFSIDKAAAQLPVMVVTGNIPVLENASSKNEQITVDSIDYVNLQDPTRNFKMTNAAMRPQGTSSMGYPKKNFRIYTKKVDSTKVYDYEGKEIANKLYSFKKGSQPVKTWCLKADYAESSGTHNTGVARLWNEVMKNGKMEELSDPYPFRTEAQKAALKNNYEFDVRTAIDGFPILLFYRLKPEDDLIFIGKYNFNNDKSTESVFGFCDVPGFDNSRMQCWEILNNGHPLALFTDISKFDTSWDDAFESRYPDTKNPKETLPDLKAFATWVYETGGDYDKWKTEKWDHLDVYKMAAYYVYLMRFGAVDQLVKNAMLTSEDGVHFYFINYDNDTVNGLINTGHLVAKPDVDRQSKNESGEYIYAGHESVLWNMLESDTEFMEIVAKVDSALSNDLSYENVIRIFDGEQADKWAERVYNQDAQYKYIGPYVEKGTNNLFMLQGKRDLHRKWWLAKRFSMFDAKWVSGAYKAKSIEVKCINDTQPGQSFTVIAGEELDYGYGINNLARESGIHLTEGQSHTFTTEETINRGDPIRIYGSPSLNTVNLSEMLDRLATIDVRNSYNDVLGSRLENLIIGRPGGNNLEVGTISGLAMCKYLKSIDVQGMKGLKSLDFTGLNYIETVKAKESGVASITFAPGSPIKRLELSDEQKIVVMDQLPYLEATGLEFSTSVHTIIIKSCPKLSQNFDFVYNWYKTKTTEDLKCELSITGIDWKDIDAEKLFELSALKTNGGILDLKGKIYLKSVNQEQVDKLLAVFGEESFRPDNPLYINAPDSVFISGPDEVLEGGEYKFSTSVFSQYPGNTTLIILKGKRDETELDPKTGVLTIIEKGYSYELTLQATHIPTQGVPTRVTKVVKVTRRVYPNWADFEMPLNIQDESTLVKLQMDPNINGIFTTEWSLNEYDKPGYLTIEDPQPRSCIIKKKKELEIPSTPITLSIKVIQSFDNRQLFTKEVNSAYLSSTVAISRITNPEVMDIVFNKGLSSNKDYMTRIEAESVTVLDSEVFRSSNIKNFEEFKNFTGLTELQSNTFQNCRDLTDIILPSNIKIIGDRCFEGTVIKRIIIPEGVISIGKYWYGGYMNFIKLPESLRHIKDCGLGGSNPEIYINKNLIDIEMPITDAWNKQIRFNVHPDNPKFLSENGILYSKDKSILYVCHQDFGKDVEYKVDPNVRVIGTNAFIGLNALSIELPDSVEELGIDCFHVSDVTTIKFGKGLKIIRNGAFFRSDFTRLDLSKTNLEYIDRGAFNGNDVQEIILPNGDGKKELVLEDEAFIGTHITTINIPSNVKKLSNNCFNRCKTLQNITGIDSIESMGTNCLRETGLETFTFPDNIKTVGENALYDCPNLREINIGPNFKEETWNHQMLGGSKQSDNIIFNVDPSNPYLSSENGILYNNDKTTIIKYTKTDPFKIPDSVTSMAKCCFDECKSPKIELNNKIDYLSWAGFKGCVNLTEFIIPDNVTGADYYCFEGCNFTKISWGINFKNPTVFTFNYCRKIDTIISKLVEPFKEMHGWGLFEQSGPDRKLYVPKDSTAYETIDFWINLCKPISEGGYGFTLYKTL